MKFFIFQVGISAAITQAAGPGLVQEFDRLSANGHLQYSQIVTTPPFNLGNQHQLLFHVRSPTIAYHSDFIGNKQVSLTRLTYSNLLQAAFIERDFASLSLPVIGTGVSGLPIQESVVGMVEAVHDFVRNSNYDGTKLLKILVINNDPRRIQLISDAVEFTLERIYATENLAQGKSLPSTSSDDSENDAKRQSSADDLDDERDVKVGVQEQKTCVICLDEVPKDPSKAKVLNKCGHEFCKDCIDGYFASAKKSCPVCNTVYGISDGTQPDGNMTVRVVSQSLPGYPGTKTIEINYSISSGVQGPKHPHPGRHFLGTQRKAYLPDTLEGREVLDLLKRAFNHKLIFTVGQSRTSGADDMVTWNDIHHKTSMHGGSSK